MIVDSYTPAGTESKFKYLFTFGSPISGLAHKY